MMVSMGGRPLNDGIDGEAMELRFLVCRKFVGAPCVECIFKLSTGRKK